MELTIFLLTIAVLGAVGGLVAVVILLARKVSERDVKFVGGMLDANMGMISESYQRGLSSATALYEQKPPNEVSAGARPWDPQRTVPTEPPGADDDSEQRTLGINT